jgi:hypothetical protein
VLRASATTALAVHAGSKVKSITHVSEAPLTHSRMLTTRRRKQKGKKEAERIAKETRRLRKQAADSAVGAPASKGREQTTFR